MDNRLTFFSSLSCGLYPNTQCKLQKTNLLCFQAILLIWLIIGSCDSRNTPSNNLPTTNMESGADLVPKSGNSNSEKNPAIENNNIIRIYLTPCISETIVREKGAQLISFLEKESNLKFELHITKNYDDMIGAFEKGIADVAIMNSLSYIKVNESCGATARLRSLRYGKSTYFGQIIARTDKNLSDLSDLQGKAIAYTDPSSTSGYLFPQKLLRNKGIEPSKTVFAG